MARLKFPTPDDMTGGQRFVYDATIAGRRGRAPANVMVWLQSPELASRAQFLGEFVRYDTTLPTRLSELAILIVARHWTSQYEWSVHHAEAVKAGVPVAIIEAIGARREPRFDSVDERAVYDFSQALLATHAVPDTVYQSTIAALGERTTVELVGLLGYYAMVAMTLNAFAVEPSPDGPTLVP